MEDNQSNIISYKKLNAEVLLALIAVLISFSTLFVYLYQSSLMKTQQKMSVWPHLTFGPSRSEDQLVINLINKGVGPAIIKKFTIKFNDNQINGIHEIMNFIPDTLQSEFQYSSIRSGQVLMAAESINLFQVNNPKTIKYLLQLTQEGKIYIEICYCSIYNDCWTSKGVEVLESKCR